MNGKPDAAQRPLLRGGDGSSSANVHPQPRAMMAVPTLNAYGYNSQANAAVIDLPRHSLEQMKLLAAQVDAISEQEKLFPLLLHKHRTNIDKLTVETSSNYTELTNLIRAEMEKTNDTTTIEMLSLLQGEFNSLSTLATSSEATMSKNFDDYKIMLYDQFGKVMTLERANLQNDLAIWRDRFQHDQQIALNQQVKISQDVANSKRDLIAHLQQQVSKFSMRLGLVLAEKKEIEGKIRDYEQVVAGSEQVVATHEQVVANLHCANEQMNATHEQTISDLQQAHDAKIATMLENDAQLVRNVQEYQEHFHQLHPKVMDLDSAHHQLQEEHQKCADPTEVNEVLDYLDKVVEEVGILTHEKNDLAEKYQALQTEYQFYAEHAEKVKNLPEIWELRTEAVQLKQEIARLSKKNKELKLELGANTPAVDECAGLAIENGLIPRVTDLGNRFQTQKLQAQVTRNDELPGEITALIPELPSQSEAMTQKLCELSELVLTLEDKNTALEEILSEYKSDPLENRVRRLQGQLETYKLLLTKDRSGPQEILNLLSGTQMQKLVLSGLHRHNPTRRFVSETYYMYSKIVRERMEQKVRQDAEKSAPNFGSDMVADKGKPYTPVAGEPVFPEESTIIWDSESESDWSLESDDDNAD
ncbi:hypothetical protein EG327_009517 [Venturia inaequalis]|uniref:Uncharacterized protein n=1 Tax=Venturia inaequalis TaxID=5025 RepID=A0A8H3UKJ6_VENIN|nr:hypothetical protein EG327_009517 [Venturia inaequalis]